ncbi:hypothetical protein GGI42DRAFT_182400 [Trichoderma sp. SZMC 28013]
MEFIFGCAFLMLVLVRLDTIRVKSYPSYTLYLLFSEPAMGKGGPSHTLVSLADSKKRASRKHSLLCTLLEWSDDTALMRRQRQLAARRSFYNYSVFSPDLPKKKTR